MADIVRLLSWLTLRCAIARPLGAVVMTAAMPYSHPQPIDRQRAFTRIKHLVPGSLLFAGAAGFINSIGLGFFRTPVSHMSGAVSHLGIDLAVGKLDDAATAGTIIAGFFAGSIAAGVLVGARKLIPGRRYGVALVCEAGLLALALILFERGSRFGLPLIAAACGLQNTTTSSYCGLVIRTTHVTGIVTDIGAMIGHWIRHRQIVRWKLFFLCGVFLAFGGGSYLGAVCFGRLGMTSLAIPSIGYALAGLALWWLASRGYFKSLTASPDERMQFVPR